SVLQKLSRVRVPPPGSATSQRTPSRRSTSRRTRRPDSASRCSRCAATRACRSGRSTAMAKLPSAAAPRRAGAGPGVGAVGAVPVGDVGMYGTTAIVPIGVHVHMHRSQAEAVEQGLLPAGLWVGRGQPLVAVEDSLGPGAEAQGLEL